VNVPEIRGMLKLRQRAFVEHYRFSAAAVRDWEQGRKTPEKAARTLLMLIDREPDAVARVWEKV